MQYRKCIKHSPPASYASIHVLRLIIIVTFYTKHVLSSLINQVKLKPRWAIPFKTILIKKTE